jgi:hypothetical protein
MTQLLNKLRTAKTNDLTNEAYAVLQQTNTLRENVNESFFNSQSCDLETSGFMVDLYYTSLLNLHNRILFNEDLLADERFQNLANEIYSLLVKLQKLSKKEG